MIHDSSAHIHSLVLFIANNATQEVFIDTHFFTELAEYSLDLGSIMNFFVCTLCHIIGNN